MRLPGFANKLLFSLKKNSPEILIVTGIVGGVTAAIIACRNAPAAKAAVDKAKRELEVLKTPGEDDKREEQDIQKDVAKVYMDTTVSVVKLYGPAVCLGVASIFCIVSSNNILRKRISGLAAAYAIVDTNFKEYRKRVAERYGEEVDRELRYDIRTGEVLDEDGVSHKVQVRDNGNEGSDYARFWDDGNKGWTKDPQYNLMFLRAQQQYANDQLRSRNYLFLNEVYEMLGLGVSEAGQVVGWLYDKNKPEGDNYVDFMLEELNPTFVASAQNGGLYDMGVHLDFNVDGYILDKAVNKRIMSKI